jgi:hypothetical protein
LDESQERPGQLFVACGDSAKLFELSDEPLDAVSGLVVLFAVFDWLNPVRL